MFQRNSGIYSYLSWLSAVIECLLITLLLLLLPGKVGIVELAYINASDIDFGGSSNNISCIDSTDWNTIDLEGASDEENSLGEVLQQDNALSTETASKDDEYGTRLKGWAEGGWPAGLAGLINQKKRMSELTFETLCL